MYAGPTKGRVVLSLGFRRRAFLLMKCGAHLKEWNIPFCYQRKNRIRRFSSQKIPCPTGTGSLAGTGTNRTADQACGNESLGCSGIGEAKAVIESSQESSRATTVQEESVFAMRNIIWNLPPKTIGIGLLVRSQIGSQLRLWFLADVNEFISTLLRGMACHSYIRIRIGLLEGSSWHSRSKERYLFEERKRISALG